MSESSADSLRTLQQAFGDSLYSAAEQVVEAGRVLEVRVLQKGSVVTGIVGGDGAERHGGARR